MAGGKRARMGCACLGGIKLGAVVEGGRAGSRGVFVKSRGKRKKKLAGSGIGPIAPTTGAAEEGGGGLRKRRALENATRAILGPGRLRDGGGRGGGQQKVCWGGECCLGSSKGKSASVRAERGPIRVAGSGVPPKRGLSL